jgi:peptidoglycan/xylan/chitin deacetylase (PgdA/CDA1 family)
VTGLVTTPWLGPGPGPVTHPPPLAVTVDVEYPDLPCGGGTDSLLELLATQDRLGFPVNFFVQGQWATAHPGLTRELVRRDPHLGLHGMAHVDYRRLSRAGASAEIDDGLAALAGIVPDHGVRWFRFPGGWGCERADLLAALAGRELVAVGWDHSSRDWDEDRSDDDCLAVGRGAVKRGGVALFHSWPSRTPRLIEQLVRAAAPGQLVALDACPLPVQGIRGRQSHPDPQAAPR